MGTAGFLSGLEGVYEQRRQEGRQDKSLLREHQANDLEKAIGDVDANPNLSPEQKAQQRAALRQQLTGLYQPHEGPSLLGRLFRIDKKQPQGGESLGIPTDGSVQPFDWSKRHSVDEVLAQIQGQQPKQQSTPIPAGDIQAGADGKYYVYERGADGTIKPVEVPGYKPPPDGSKEKIDGWLKDAQGNNVPARIENGKLVPYGLPEGYTAGEKPSDKPEETLKYDKDTGQITDTRSGKRWSEGDPNQPKDVAEMFKGAERIRDERTAEEDKKYNQQLSKMLVGLNYAIEKGEIAPAQREVGRLEGLYDDASIRMKSMDSNLPKALNGDQQAMVGILSDHVGMTLGLQKNARITRAYLDEAKASAPWLQSVEAKFSPEGYLTGVTLTPEQMRQMVDMGHSKLGIAKDVLDDAQGRVDSLKSDYGVKTTKGKGSPSESKPSANKPGSGKKWSKSAYLKKHPGANIEQKSKEATAAGYEVVD